MLPRDKYTIFSSKAVGYRKGIHKVPKWTRVFISLCFPNYFQCQRTIDNSTNKSPWILGLGRNVQNNTNRTFPLLSPVKIFSRHNTPRKTASLISGISNMVRFFASRNDTSRKMCVRAGNVIASDIMHHASAILSTKKNECTILTCF